MSPDPRRNPTEGAPATRVLVTGVEGPVGRAIVRGLLARPEVAHVAAVASVPVPESGTLDADRFTWLPMDLAHPREVHALLYGPARALGVDTVVHTALATTATRGGRRVHALNVGSTRALLSMAERHPTVRRFIYRSHGDVYDVGPGQPVLVSEDAPLALAAHAPQRVRDRVEADVTVATRLGLSPLRIAVLRMAEILAPDTGSQLYDYLLSRVCFRPFGYDPMLNLLSLEDAVEAVVAAVATDAVGVFNIPGADTLPLSRIIDLWGRLGVAVPGPLLTPLYRARTTTLGLEFRYDLNYRRFHFSAVLDGSRARAVLGYRPRHPLIWPKGTSPPAPGGPTD